MQASLSSVFEAVAPLPPFSHRPRLLLLRLYPSSTEPHTLLDRLHDAVAADCEPAGQRLQEAVEFLSRTKAADRLRLRRLKEALAALPAIYAGKIEALDYEGLFDETLVRLQDDDYESLLLRLEHNVIGESDGMDNFPKTTNGSDSLRLHRRISETLAADDRLNIAIDTFVVVIKLTKP